MKPVTFWCKIKKTEHVCAVATVTEQRAKGLLGVLTPLVALFCVLGGVWVSAEQFKVYCVNCGAELNEETGYLASPDWYEDTRFVHYCRDCQQKQFEDFAENTSPAFAYFLCCAAYNLPFIPEALPNAAYEVDEITWHMYLQNLDAMDYRYRGDDEPAAFCDGVTDLKILFEGRIDKNTKFAAGVSMERAAGRLPGTKAQRRNWGTLDGYTDADYKELDRLYSIESADRLENGISAQEEYILREICKLKLSYSRSRAKGDIQEAKNTYALISKMMEDNLLRKKDEAPLAPIKIDTMAEALEKKGYLRKGKILSYPDLLEKLQGDQAKYPMSHDMLDYIIRELINCTKRNFGVPPSDALPFELQFKEKFDELDPEMSKEEKQIVKDLGLRPMKYEKKPKPEKGAKKSASREKMEQDPTPVG